MIVSHPNLNMYRPGSVTRPANAQVILLTCCVAFGRTRKGFAGIVVFHFIFAYSPTCHRNARKMTAWMTSL